MASKTKTKQQYEEWVEEDTELSEEFTDKMNALFFRMLKNPSDKEIDTFKTVRDALIVAFILDLMDRYKEQLKNAMQVGRTVAQEQIKRLNIKDIVKKTINDKKYNDMLDSVLEINKTTLTYVLDGIKVNTDNIIKDIKSNVIETKKVLSTELAAEFAKNGISEFQDKLGRRISINNYIKQKSLDEITKMMRNSYFMEGMKYGVPYVRIVHLNLHPSCPLCSVFEGKILALEDNDEGVMTVDEAYSYGMWHNSCDHVPMEMLLENDITGEEKNIKIDLNEQNKKRKKYMDRKGYKFRW